MTDLQDQMVELQTQTEEMRIQLAVKEEEMQSALSRSVTAATLTTNTKTWFKSSRLNFRTSGPHLNQLRVLAP